MYSLFGEIKHIMTGFLSKTGGSTNAVLSHDEIIINNDSIPIIKILFFIKFF
jgi:hypothetical protein